MWLYHSILMPEKIQKESEIKFAHVKGMITFALPY